MQLQVNQLLQKQDEMENRLRRCNLRFIGLPEGEEGAEPPPFLEQLLCTTYGKEAFPTTFVVELAQCMSLVSASPRTFIAKLINYRDRDTILRQSREKGNIPYGKKIIVVFPDFSAEVQRRHKSFTEAKRRLRIKYAMLFPAGLRVEGDDRVHFFDLDAAIFWLEHRETCS